MINRFDNLVTELNSKTPLSIIRLGNVEAHNMLMKGQKIYTQMYTNAGFFGDEEDNRVWKALVLKALMNADCNMRVVTCNSFWICDDVLTQLNLFIPTLPYVEDLSFYVTLLNNLNTSNIGIVSYFKKDIESQISKMDFIHKRRPITNNYRKWKIIKSENTIKGNEPQDKKWLDVYNDLLDRCLKADCDIYLLSCGCYGIPLCNDLKLKGKKAFYVGGFLQLLFGLKGSRWSDRKIVTQYYNKHWRYPSEKPVNASQVEGWCYGESTENPHPQVS